MKTRPSFQGGGGGVRKKRQKKVEPLKNIFVKNHWARKAGTNLEAYLGTVDYKLFNHGFLWIYKGHNMESKFYKNVIKLYNCADHGTQGKDGTTTGNQILH